MASSCTARAFPGGCSTCGRCCLFSLSALEAEFVGNAQAPWPVLVERLASQRVVDTEAVRTTQALFAFGLSDPS